MNTGSASAADIIAVNEAMYRAMYGNTLIDLVVMVASYALIFALVHLARKRSDAMFAPLYTIAGLFLISALVSQLVAFYFYVNQAYTVSIVIKAVSGTLAVMSAVMIWPVFMRLRLMTEAGSEKTDSPDSTDANENARVQDMVGGVTQAEREALKMSIDVSERRYEQLLVILEKAVFRQQAMNEQQIAAILNRTEAPAQAGASSGGAAQAASVAAALDSFA